MRDHGTLTKWNDDRGFGFISPAWGNRDIFVHISAFPRDGRRPELHELVSFETETGPNGKLRAVRIMRPCQRTASYRPEASGRGGMAPKPTGMFFCLLAVIVLGVYSYTRLAPSGPRTQLAPTAIASPAPGMSSKCDGRTRCSQMTSCEEARYFLQHCPNTQMDGDNDGEPCERQWCN